MYFDNAISTTNTCRRSVLAVFFAGAVLGLSACSDGSDSTNEAPFVPNVDPNDVVPAASSESMADFLIQNMDYGTLLRLIEDADLASDLQGDNMGLGWTLFAPSDNAFVNDSFESMTAEQRVSLIKSHLYSGTLQYSDLAPGQLNMVEGSVEIVQSENGIPVVGGSTIVARDRLVANGVIHFVDSVLTPIE